MDQYRLKYCLKGPLSPKQRVCISILVTTLPEWLSSTEPLLHTPGAVLVMYVVFCEHAQFCRFDKVDATADVQWHCNHWPPLWYHYFPAQSSLGTNILVYWIGKIVQTCAHCGSRTLDFHALKASTLCTRPGSPIFNNQNLSAIKA